jgi:hypothetical protein
MGLPSYMRSVVMRRIPVFGYSLSSLIFLLMHLVGPNLVHETVSLQYLLFNLEQTENIGNFQNMG